MGKRRKHLKAIALFLSVLALLVGTYKIAEHLTEKESYREGYTFGYVEGHTNGYIRGVDLDGKSEPNCEIEYGNGLYADVHCYHTINGKRYHNGWAWPDESYVGPGPDGVPATSGPNAPNAPNAK
ncbi:hypothetical protein [Shimazuella kribbensis]|uniref:hypothetical protein n=1 Tax=Shimazuella kribbensis TaxID=139808 RepID=UPI00048C291E|nr:hypothetical protein [Shimazuella kribbensis]